GDGLDGKTVVVSGSGNVAIYAIAKVEQLGGTVIACSDSSGYVVDEDGVDAELLREIKETERGRISEYAERRPGARFVPGECVWEVPCQVALPCATQNEIDVAEATALV